LNFGFLDGDILFCGKGFDSGLQSFGGNRTWVNGVDPHTVLDSTVSEDFCEIHQRGVDCAADGKFRRTRPPADADDVDDAAPGLSQVSSRGAGEAHGAVKFEGETVCPFVVGQGEEVTAFGCACVVDNQVERAKFFQRSVHDAGG
jgi:hypothetical protein